MSPVRQACQGGCRLLPRGLPFRVPALPEEKRCPVNASHAVATGSVNGRAKEPAGKDGKKGSRLGIALDPLDGTGFAGEVAGMARAGDGAVKFDERFPAGKIERAGMRAGNL